MKYRMTAILGPWILESEYRTLWERCVGPADSSGQVGARAGRQLTRRRTLARELEVALELEVELTELELTLALELPLELALASRLAKVDASHNKGTIVAL